MPALPHRRRCNPLSAWLLGALVLAACSDDALVRDGGVLLLVVDDQQPLTDRLAKEASAYLTRLAGSTPQLLVVASTSPADLEAAARSRAAALVIALDVPFDLATGAATATDKSGPSGFRLQQREVGEWDNRWLGQGATVLATQAGTALARQYALYEVLRRLGCRFYHPEQEYVPRHHPPDLRALARRPTIVARMEGTGHSEHYVPDFSERGFTFHGSHPLEHLESFSDGAHPLAEAEHVNQWIVKNRANHFRGAGRGVAPPDRRAKRAKELVELAALLGFGGGSGITLHNQQQGGNASVDPASATPVQQQIENYVDSHMSGSAILRWFGIHFGPTEFTVTPDQETVQWINWAGQRALANDPKITVLLNNHITGSQPTPHFNDLGCPTGTNGDGRGDYYDLAFHTDERFGVKVHTVMFYPLEGAAPVYNQKSFAHKLCLMKRASAAGRPLWWFPEGSWWLSFDNPIPVYLPLYIWTRGRDVELTRPLLASRGGGTLVGHRMFNSGHEWGYWQQDYAVGLWHWNADVTLDEVLGELFDPLCKPALLSQGCAARTDAMAVLQEVMAWQKQDFLDAKDFKGLAGGRYAYFSGEDPADEVAEATGFAFRPVRVAFNLVAKWSAKEIKHFRDTDLAALAAADSAHDGWLNRLADLSVQVPSAGRPWLDEVVDGLAINQLRARQTQQLYGAVLAWREADLVAAAALLKAAEQTLADAAVVVARRESAYRYPAAQTHGGGVTKDTAVANGTTYPWRVHTKTHLLSYWHNRHKRAANLIAGQAKGGDTALRLTPAMALPGVALKASWPELPGMTAKVLMGDGTTLAAGAAGHDYGDKPGWWSVGGSMLSDGHEIPVAGKVARADRLGHSPSGSIELIKIGRAHV